MASEQGYITEPFTRIAIDIWASLNVHNFSQIYSDISPNPVAAVPSLHSAFPLIIAMFLVKAFGLRRMWWVLLYPLSMWVGVVYLGEHYVFDVLAAVALVLVTSYLIQYLFHWFRSRPKSA